MTPQHPIAMPPAARVEGDTVRGVRPHPRRHERHRHFALQAPRPGCSVSTPRDERSVRRGQPRRTWAVHQPPSCGESRRCRLHADAMHRRGTAAGGEARQPAREGRRPCDAVLRRTANVAWIRRPAAAACERARQPCALRWEPRGADALRTLQALPLTRHAHAALLPRIWALRGHVTAYDAAYVALAEALGATLLTRDHRLSRVAAATDIHVL